MGFAQLKPENEFYTKAPRNIIFVQSSRLGECPVTLIWSSQKKGDCFTDEHIPKHFCIVRVISVSGRRSMHGSYQIFSKADLFNMIFDSWLPKEVTLVFGEWHTPWYVSNPSLENPLRCKSIRSISTESQFHPSSRLIADAQHYEDRFLSSKNRMAIMFRFERMMIYLNITQHRDNKDTYVAKCLHKVINIAEKTWEKGGGFSRPLVTLDLGKYGSIGMRQRTVPKLNQLAESTLSSLLHNKWTFSELYKWQVLTTTMDTLQLYNVH